MGSVVARPHDFAYEHGSKRFSSFGNDDGGGTVAKQYADDKKCATSVVFAGGELAFPRTE